MADPGHAAGNQVYVLHPKCLCGDLWTVHKIDTKGVRKACYRAEVEMVLPPDRNGES